MVNPFEIRDGVIGLSCLAPRKTSLHVASYLPLEWKSTLSSVESCVNALFRSPRCRSLSVGLEKAFFLMYVYSHPG